MSYDIYLYDAEFLRTAIGSGLGDWTGSPYLSHEVITAAVHMAKNFGFVPKPHPAGFAEFLLSEGVTPSIDFQLETPEVLADLQLFKNSISLTVPYSDRALTSVQVARNFGLQLASGIGLGFYDPQADDDLVGAA